MPDSGPRRSPAARRTRQREAILAAVRCLPGHPTAQEVHARVQAELPRISLGTVYRNLGAFVRTGRLVRIPVDRGQARYDGNPKPHWHIQCVRCGKVRDVREPPFAPEVGGKLRLGGFTVLELRCHWRGICPHCRSREKERSAQARSGR